MAVQSFYTMDGNGRKKEKRKGHPPLTCLFSMRTCENYVQIRTNQFHQKIKMNKSKFERPAVIMTGINTKKNQNEVSNRDGEEEKIENLHWKLETHTAI